MSSTQSETDVWHSHFKRPLVVTDEWSNVVEGMAPDDDPDGFLQFYSDAFADLTDVQPGTPHGVPELMVQDEPGRRAITQDSIAPFFQWALLDPSEKDFVLPSVFATGNSHAPETRRRTIDQFASSISENPITVDLSGPESARTRLGGNRVAYVIGEVGVGKSLLLALAGQLISRRNATLDDSSDPLPVTVYLSLEHLAPRHSELEDASDLHAALLKDLLETTYRVAEQEVPELGADWTAIHASAASGAEGTASAIASLCLRLAALSPPRRLVLFIDNLDVWHYPDLRYLFFPESYGERTSQLAQRVTLLLQEFDRGGRLGDFGMCVTVAMRSNLPRELEYFTKGTTNTDADAHEHAEFMIEGVSSWEVIQSRLEILGRGLEAVMSAKNPAFHQALMILRARMQNSLRDPETGEVKVETRRGLRVISDLAHHGHRSLVGFLRRIPVHIVQEQDVVERLFPRGREPRLLERLYIAKGFHRFSQAQMHFPNMYVVDGFTHETVEPVEHAHTYWLKYLLLRRILLARKGRVRVRDVVDEFVGTYGYSERLVRLALGSLASVNEFGCIKRQAEFALRCDEIALYASRRGRVLVEHQDQDVPFCLEWTYLQLAAEDHWLWVPKAWAEDFLSEGTMAHALVSGSDYASALRRELQARIPVVLLFARILDASWTVETEFRAELKDSDIGPPSFEVVYRRLERAIGGVADHAGVDCRDYMESFAAARKRPEFEEAFRSYFTEALS